MSDQSRTDYYNRRVSSMKRERESFIHHYKDLSTFINPRRGRFFIQDRNRGQKVHQDIINSAGTQALRIARSGMLAGVMSPSRPWFDLETPDPAMMEIQEVKEWIAQVVRILRTIFNVSNLYDQAPAMLGELLEFGTGFMMHVDDFDDVARFYTQTVGSYMIAQNSRLVVDTFAREFEWTVQQMVQEFGLENVSTAVKNDWDRGNYDKWYPIVHFVEPNVNSKSRPVFASDAPFASVYYEPGNMGPDRDKLLSKSGFQEFPAYVPRWDVTGEDIYGTDCPGMTALGDIKSLQQEERVKARGLQKLVDPPLSGPASLRNVPVNTLPGGLTIYSGSTQQDLRAVYQVDPRLQEMRIDMQDITNRINQAFFVDMFLAISQMEGIQPRNELDILSRNEERLLQLGPVLERLHGEFLERMVDRTFNQALRAGILPPFPEILSGQNLQVKFISSLAIAQRAVVTADLDRILAATANAATVDPQAIKKFDGPQFVDEYAKAIGVPPRVIRSDEVVQALIQQENEQLQQQRMMEMAMQGATAVNQAGGVKTDERNLITDVARVQGES